MGVPENQETDALPAGVPQIEVTPEMIEVGIEAFASFYPDSASDGDYAEKAVTAIWSAMLDRSRLAPAFFCELPPREQQHRGP